MARASVWNRLQQAITAGTQRFLAAAPPECLVCNAPVRGGRSALGLCTACFASIPWITDIRCSVCGRYEECGDCGRRKDTFFVCSRSAVRYDETMRAWLAQYKYRGNEALQPLLGAMLHHAFMNLLQAAQTDKFDAIVSVPANSQRLLERGFNQAERLAREVSQRHKVPVYPLLTRVRDTAKMSFKTRSERLTDLKGAFGPDTEGIARLQAAAKGIGGQNRLRLLIVDDVYTTGSTLNQCAAVLAQAVPEALVYGLTWAR